MEGELSGTRRWQWGQVAPILGGLLRVLARPVSLLVLGASLAIVLVVAPLVYMEVYKGRVIPGVRVLGQHVGGMEAGVAREVVERGASRFRSVPLVLEAGGQRWQVLPEDLGIRIEVDSTLSEVLTLGRGEFPTRAGLVALGALLWGLEYPAVLRVDEGRLDAFLDTVAAHVRVPARDAALMVRDGRVEKVVDQPGVQLDLEAARRAILYRVARGKDGEISLPVTVEMPKLDWHTVAPYQDRLVQALGGTVLLTAGSYGELLNGPKLWSLVKGTAYDPGAPDGVGVALEPSRTATLMAALNLKSGSPARDAALSVSSDGQVILTPERIGIGVTEQGLRRALAEALLRSVPVASVPLEPVAHPVISREDLEEAKAAAEAILSRDIVLYHEDRIWKLGRRELASALVFSGVGRGTQPKLDPQRLSQVIASIPFGIDQSGRIERVAWWGGPVVVGSVVDPEATARAVAEGGNFVQIRFRPALPELPAAKMPAERPDKWIDVNLTSQALVAYEGSVPVYYTLVSTGRPGHATPTGTFRIYIKLVKDSMSNGTFGVSPEDPDYYNLKDVPYVMYFLTGGYAIHGTYWHNNFGHVMSHGCVNAPTPAAQWIFQWAELGTPVVVHY